MNDNDEFITLYSNPQGKKKKNVYRLPKINQSNSKCIIILIIFSLTQSIIIIYLLLNSNQQINSENKICNITINTNEIIDDENNEKDNNVKDNNNVNIIISNVISRIKIICYYIIF